MTQSLSPAAMLCADLQAVQKQIAPLRVHIAGLLARCQQEKADVLKMGYHGTAHSTQVLILQLSIVETSLARAHLDAERLAEDTGAFAASEGITPADIQRLAISSNPAAVS